MVFVRHALPGERVVVEVTEGSEGDRFWRGDAVEVLEASPDRVDAALPVRRARAAAAAATSSTSRLPAQRGAQGGRGPRAARPAGRARRCDVVVEEVPPTRCAGAPGCGTSRCPDGRRGLREHRSDEVVADRRLPDRRRALPRADRSRPCETSYGSHDFAVDPDGFWQSHLEAPRVLVETVLALLAPRPGERVLDLYAGVGLFAAFLADAVGPTGAGGGRRGLARRLPRRPRQPAGVGAQVEHGPVDRVLAASYDEPFDLVVLDPPREGARRTVVEQIVDRAPRAVAYVACDPAALARDLATFAEHGLRRCASCAPSTCSR